MGSEEIYSLTDIHKVWAQDQCVTADVTLQVSCIDKAIYRGGIGHVNKSIYMCLYFLYNSTAQLNLCSAYMYVFFLKDCDFRDFYIEHLHRMSLCLVPCRS